MKHTTIGLTASSFLLLVATCLLWYRGLSGVDEVTLDYNRYLANGRAASSSITATSDHRLWLKLSAGSVPPFHGQLVWGYHVNADNSGGKPQLRIERSRYASPRSLHSEFLSPDSSGGRWPTDETAMLGWGPLRWQFFRRVGGGEQAWWLTAGLSHWLAAALLLVPITIGLRLLRQSGKQT